MANLFPSVAESTPYQTRSNNTAFIHHHDDKKKKREEKSDIKKSPTPPKRSRARPNIGRRYTAEPYTGSDLVLRNGQWSPCNGTSPLSTSTCMSDDATSRSGKEIGKIERKAKKRSQSMIIIKTNGWIFGYVQV